MPAMLKNNTKKPVAKSAPRATPADKKGLHPRNKHGGRYDFAELVQCCPELAAFVAPNAYGDVSVDFADPNAVRALNRALLKQHYGINGWDLPAQYLCPPIPGRADYLHYLADLLARSNGGNIPYGDAIRVLDIGVGANVVYPLIGHSEYGWSFVGSDIDRTALACAQATVDANSGHRDAVEVDVRRVAHFLDETVVCRRGEQDVCVQHQRRQQLDILGDQGRLEVGDDFFDGAHIFGRGGVAAHVGWRRWRSVRWRHACRQQGTSEQYCADQLVHGGLSWRTARQAGTGRAAGKLMSTMVDWQPL